MNEKKIVAVSGGFDPLHIGHLRLMQEARKQGDYLIVFLNTDDFLIAKKGRPFMPFAERKELIEGFACVDEVVATLDPVIPEPPYQTQCETLRHYRPDIFANGGDRKSDNIPEYAVCEEEGIKMVFNMGEGGKVQSSSDLVTDYHEWLLENKEATIHLAAEKKFGVG